MPRKRAAPPKPSLWDAAALEAFCESHGFKASHVPRLYRAAFRLAKCEDLNVARLVLEEWEPLIAAAAAKGVPTGLLSLLPDNFALALLKVVNRADSKDDATTKLVFELHDSHRVETVLMDMGGRTTVCVSSQVGCAMGCQFCATGTLGILGDLTAAEILEQVLWAGVMARTLTRSSTAMARRQQAPPNPSSQKPSPTAPTSASAAAAAAASAATPTTTTAPEEGSSAPAPVVARAAEDLLATKQPWPYPSNVVFMGQGEPLRNYDAVVKALEGFCDVSRFAMQKQHVTVSTVGVVSAMERLTREHPDVSLALSLHAPNDDLRGRIVPAAKGQSLRRLMAALDGHIAACRRHSHSSKGLMVEYVLLEGVNDSDATAAELGALLHGKHVMLNLIPYNPNVTAERHGFRPPSLERCRRFGKIIMDDYGLRVRLRQEMGQDIAAACGQLALVTPPSAASTGAAPAPAPATATATAPAPAAGSPADIEELVPSSAPPRGVAQGVAGSKETRLSSSGRVGRRSSRRERDPQHRRQREEEGESARSFNAAPKIAAGDKASEGEEGEKNGGSGKTGTSATTRQVEAIDTRNTENSQPSGHGFSRSVFVWLRKQQASRETVLFVVATTAVCALLLHRTKRSSS